MTGAPASSFPEHSAAVSPVQPPNQNTQPVRCRNSSRSFLTVAGDLRSRRQHTRRLGGHGPVQRRRRLCVLAWWEGRGGQGVPLIRTLSPSPGLHPRALITPTFWYHRLGGRFPLPLWGRYKHLVCGAGFQGFSGELAGHNGMESPSKNGGRDILCLLQCVTSPET